MVYDMALLVFAALRFANPEGGKSQSKVQIQ
jgi:hypothetical protein